VASIQRTDDAIRQRDQLGSVCITKAFPDAGLRGLPRRPTFRELLLTGGGERQMSRPLVIGLDHAFDETGSLEDRKIASDGRSIAGERLREGGHRYWLQM
jgi:hypothetical protein